MSQSMSPKANIHHFVLFFLSPRDGFEDSASFDGEEFDDFI
jgi:hypothetical protein